MGFWSKVVGIIGVVAAPFTGGASLVLTAASVVAPKVVDKVVDFVMKPFLGLMGVPALDGNSAAEAERQQGVLLQRQGSVNNIPVVYGYRKVGDIVTFAETGASDNKYLWVAHVFSEGPIAGLWNVYIDDNILPEGVVTKLNAGQTVTIDSGKYANRVKLQFFKGVYYADPTPANNIVRSNCFFNTDSDRPPNWTSDMVYNGLAVMFARYEWKKVTTQAEQDANPFGYSIPSMSVEMLGKVTSAVPQTAPAQEYDTDTARYQTIVTGSGQTIGYTNPVEALLDYLRNPRYGKGLKNADIDWASWYIAAQKCQTEVTYVNGIKGPIMSMNFVLDTSQTIFNNTKTLLSNFRGYMPYVQGKYKLKIEDAGHPTDITSGSAEIVATFDKNNIIGEIVYTGIERTSKYNQVTVTYIDPDNKWSNQEVVYPETEAERQTYITQDGGRENKGQFTASGITNSIIAKDLARILFWKSRLSDSISVTVSSQGLELEPGDCIHISGNLLSFTNTYPWRVISSTLNNDMSVTLGCVFIPDYIFPYTRWGEPDRLLPVYIPKGAERYYPKITPSEKNGLLPPYPNKPETPVTGVPVSSLVDVIEITKVGFVAIDNKPLDQSSNIYADVYFNQPNTSLYYSTKFYWKEDVASAVAWQETEIPQQPGAGQSITARFGPFTYGKDYILNTRVIYQSNQPSSQTGSYKFKVQGTTAIPSPGPGIPGTQPSPPANLADNFFSSVIATTLLDGTSPNQIPKNPRQISVTVQQDISQGTNPYLDSLEIFYKPSANPKWSYTKTILTQSQGSSINFTLTLGPRVYPLRPGYNNEIPATVDDYDFIFRWSYNDSKVSKYQWHARNISVEWNGLTWGPFNPFALSGADITAKELSSDYIPQIAGPNDIVETRNIKISEPYSIRDLGAVTQNNPPAVRMFFHPPVDSDRINWLGVRVYRHKAGVAGLGDYIDITPATYSSGLWSILVPGITYDDVWEYVLVTLVNYAGETTESNSAQYIKGYLHPRSGDTDYPSDSNWQPSWVLDAVEATATALAKRGTAQQNPPRQDTYINTFSSATVLTNSLPQSPRQLSFTFTQSTANGVNGHITAYSVYYKQSDSTYWKRSQYNLTSYTEGTAVTFTSNQTSPVMDLGLASYPNFPGREQNYDFVIRFVYDNGMESTYEHAFLNKVIENSGTGTGGSAIYSFSFLGTPGNALTSRRSSQVLTTEDQAPPGAVLDPRNILTATSMYPLALEVMEPPAKNNQLRFGFATPIAELKGKLVGFRILRRDVIAGLVTEYTTDDSNQPYKSVTTTINNASVNLVAAISLNTEWHKEYEWAVIPLVWHQSAKTEANNSLYWRGRVCDQTNSTAANPFTANWFSRRAAEVLTTTEIRNKLLAAFPETNPVVRPSAITRTNPNYTATGGRALGYWTITYQVPANFVSAKIYRRQCRDFNSTASGQSGYYQGPSNFGDAGQWELITINNNDNPVSTANGISTQTVNLRPAIADYFNDKSLQYGYNLSKPKSSTQGQQNTLYQGYNIVRPSQQGSTYSKYWLAGDSLNAAGNSGKITQILIRITTLVNGQNQESAAVVRIDLYNERVVNGVTTPNAPGNISTDVSTVLFADVESSLDVTAITGVTVDASWTTLLRKPSEAINLVADNLIIRPGQQVWTTTYTKPSASPGVL